MAIQQSDIDKVRASVHGQLGNKVMIQLDRGRNRIDIQEGIIKGAYPSVFTILVEEGHTDEIVLSRGRGITIQHK